MSVQTPDPPPVGCRAVSRHRKVMGVHDTFPIVSGDVFVAPNASVIGDVTLGSGSSVWYGAILRGAMTELLPGSALAHPRLAALQAATIRAAWRKRSC